MITGLTVFEVWMCLMTAFVVAADLYPGYSEQSLILGGVTCGMLASLLMILFLIVKNQPRGPKGGGEA